MSESYTIGDDTDFKIYRNNWIAQTFTPVEDHRLWFVHLKLHGSPAHYWALMSVQNTLDGIPTGEILDEFPIWLDDLSEYSPGRIWRPTLHGTANLLAGTQYAIVISRGNMRWGDWVRWRGQSAGATYPRGQRLSSSDGGASWTPHPDSDCYFVEFGKPPLPKPEPPPPIDHFATLDIKYEHHPTAITFTLTTGVPCHLTCYWTDKKPLKHPTSRTVRGITLPWSTYFCFVSWHAVEQQEPGDTLYHTFEMLDWIYCETKWFTFRGEVDNIQSPSVGPIFEHHHSVIPPKLFEYDHPSINYIWYSIYDWGRQGQSFISPKAHTMSKVVANLSKYGSPTSSSILLKATDSEGKATGRILASGEINLDDVPVFGSYGPVEVSLTRAISANKQYCFLLATTGNDPRNWVGWAGVYRWGTYPRGCRISNTGLMLHPEDDLWFEEWA